jgi:hypothetical protein
MLELAPAKLHSGLWIVKNLADHGLAEEEGLAVVRSDLKALSWHIVARLTQDMGFPIDARFSDRLRQIISMSSIGIVA